MCRMQTAASLVRQNAAGRKNLGVDVVSHQEQIELAICNYHKETALPRGHLCLENVHNIAGMQCVTAKTNVAGCLVRQGPACTPG